MAQADSIAIPTGPQVQLRRKQPSVFRQFAGTTLFYALGYPLTRVLALFGKWPQVLGRDMGRRHSRAKEYTPTANDVLVCSYFKTGTNWTMQIAVQIAHRGAAEFGHIHDLVPWLEVSPRMRMAVPVTDDSVWQNCPTKLRVIKTHVSLENLVYVPEAKYIWIVRDPKDVFVSSYHFMKKMMLGWLMPTPEQWLDLFLSPNTPEGSWAEHLDGGWRNRHRDNVVFLTYEEMKADLPSAVRKIAVTMGVDLNEAELARVVEQASYKHMKSVEHKFDPPGMPWVNSQGAMVRRGERGSADELLNAEQKRRLDKYWRAELRRIGSDFPYDEKFGVTE
jgi:hypothetical protein